MARKKIREKTSKKKLWTGVLIGVIALTTFGCSDGEITNEATPSTQAVAGFGILQTNASEVEETLPASTEVVSTESSAEESLPDTHSTAETSTEVSTEYLSVTEAPTEVSTEILIETPTEPPTQAPPETTAPPETQMVAQIATQAAPVGEIVYITESGKKYHRSGCRYLSNSKIEISLADAVLTYEPCSVCDP